MYVLVTTMKTFKSSCICFFSREGFATVPNVTFEDVGALDDIREELEMAVCAPVNYPEVVASLGTHQQLNEI